MEEIRLTSPKEVINTSQGNLNPQIPGYVLITDEILKQLSQKVTVKPINLINVAFIFEK